MSYTASLYSPQQAHTLLADLWPKIKASLTAGHRLQITVRREKRSLDQNAKFHAICEDLAKSDVTWAGKRRDKHQWKLLLVSGHATATRREVEIVPGLEGEFLNIRESTADMDKDRKSSLIEYALAFCAAHEVEVRDELP